MDAWTHGHIDELRDGGTTITTTTITTTTTTITSSLSELKGKMVWSLLIS